MNSRFFPSQVASRIPLNESETLFITEGLIKQGLSLAKPIPVAWQARSDVYVPAIFGGDAVEVFWRKATTSQEAALRYAERVLHFRKLRTNEARRRLAAISDPWWVEIVADMNRHAKPLTVHRPVNRERCSHINPWGR
jgi:hypothetical protein